MNGTNTHAGSLLFVLCIIINIIMVSSIGVFSLLLMTKETIQFRITSHKQISITHSLLNYGINTILAHNNRPEGDSSTDIVITVPEIPDIPTDTIGMIRISGTQGLWQVESQLLDRQTILCKISCTLKNDAGSKRVIQNWRLG